MLSVEEFDDIVERLRTAFPDPFESLSQFHFSHDLVRGFPSLVVRKTEEGFDQWLDQPANRARLVLNVIDQYPEARDLLHTFFIWADESPIMEFVNEPPLYLRPVRAQMLAEGRPKRKRGRPSAEVRKTVIIALLVVLVEAYGIPACGDNEDSEHTAYDIIRTAFSKGIPTHATAVDYWKDRESLIKGADGIIHVASREISIPLNESIFIGSAYARYKLFDEDLGFPNTTEHMQDQGISTFYELWAWHNRYKNLQRYSLQTKI